MQRLCAVCEWLCESTVRCVRCVSVQCRAAQCAVQSSVGGPHRPLVSAAALTGLWALCAAVSGHYCIAPLCGHAAFVRFLLPASTTPPGTSCSATAHRTGQRRHATDQTNEMASLSDALALHHCAPRCRRLRTGCGHSTHMPHRRVALEAGQWSAAVVSVMTISRQTDRSTERRRTEAGR